MREEGVRGKAQRKEGDVGKRRTAHSYRSNPNFHASLSIRHCACPATVAPYPHVMLHYFKFRQDLFAPVPAKEIYIKRGPGRGWPEECPPVRAANAFGFDLLANFDITFCQSRAGRWSVEPDITIESDFDYASQDNADGRPLAQQYAWFWQKGQKLPHVISDNVYARISNQVKISSYLFMKTDPNELLLIGDVPNLSRPWRAISALIDTDWYPASYPWHAVIELDRAEKKIAIRKGDPLCRIVPVRRDTYFAQQMSHEAFDEFFTRGQAWLKAHGRFEHEGTVDITRTYSKQQIQAKFTTLD
jgi:hypothetical protein